MPLGEDVSTFPSQIERKDLTNGDGDGAQESQESRTKIYPPRGAA